MPTFQRVGGLEATLRPLLDDPAAAEIIVVDDGLDDAATRLVASLHEPRLRAVNIDNSGRARARQVGLEHATQSVVVLLDDDVVAEPGLISGHVELARSGLVVVGYMGTIAPGGRIGAFATNWYIEQYEAHCRIWRDDPGSILRHFWGGNTSMMRKDALSIGIHNPAFDARYHDDYEFGLRCHNAGLDAAFVPSLRARHVHTFTISQYIANGRKQGHDWPIIHALHPEMGAYDPARVSQGALGPLIRLTRRPRAYRTAQALRALAAVPRVARLLTRIEHQQGAFDGLAVLGARSAAPAPEAARGRPADRRRVRA